MARFNFIERHADRFRNSFWMIVEKLLSFAALIFVTSAVARYAGAATFGQITFATTIFGLGATLATLGLDQIYFKQVSRSQMKSWRRLGLIASTFVALNYLIACCFIFLFVKYFRASPSFDEIVFFVGAMIFSFLAAIDFRKIHLDAVMASRVNVLCNVFGILVGIIARYLVVQWQLPVYYFGYCLILMGITPYVFRYFIFNNKLILENSGQAVKISKQHLGKYIKYLSSAGLGLGISHLAVVIYTQANILYLAALQDDAAVGNYGAANMIAGLWYFLVVIFVTSFISIVYKAKNDVEYVEKSSSLFRFLLCVIIPCVVFLFFFGGWIVSVLYGPEYTRANGAVRILTIAYFFSAIGFYFYRLTIKRGGYHFLAVKMVFMCFIHLAIAYPLIRSYSILGAAFATLITEFLSSIFLNILYKNLLLMKILKKSFLG